MAEGGLPSVAEVVAADNPADVVVVGEFFPRFSFEVADPGR